MSFSFNQLPMLQSDLDALTRLLYIVADIPEAFARSDYDYQVAEVVEEATEILLDAKCAPSRPDMRPFVLACCDLVAVTGEMLKESDYGPFYSSTKLAIIQLGQELADEDLAVLIRNA